MGDHILVVLSAVVLGVLVCHAFGDERYCWYDSPTVYEIDRNLMELRASCIIDTV